MCNPIPGNFVRARRNCTVKPLKGSTESLLSRKSPIIVDTQMRGMVDEKPAKDDKHRLIIFELEEAGLSGAMFIAEMHCDDLKGVEL